VVRNTCAILVGYMLAGTALHIHCTFIIHIIFLGGAILRANVMIADLCDV